MSRVWHSSCWRVKLSEFILTLQTIRKIYKGIWRVYGEKTTVDAVSMVVKWLITTLQLLSTYGLGRMITVYTRSRRH